MLFYEILDLPYILRYTIYTPHVDAMYLYFIYFNQMIAHPLNCRFVKIFNLFFFLLLLFYECRRIR